MSADEDTELRDLVAQTLETNGVLSNIRAQLRANVFLALEEQENVQNKKTFINHDLVKFMSTKEGRQITGLVREFLDFFKLDYTKSVFDPESSYQYHGRDSLARDLDIVESDLTHSPLLAEVIKRGSSSNSTKRSNSAESITNISDSVSSYPQNGTWTTFDYGKSSKELGIKHIQEAAQKFRKYDKDKSGTIEKNELRDLFSDMFPNFHQNMLDRYVNEEFRASDRDFSNTIDFDEFLELYKRLFVLCKSSVAAEVSDITLHSPRFIQDKNSKIPAPLKKSNITSSQAKPVESAKTSDKSQPTKMQDSHKEVTFDPENDSFFDDILSSEHSNPRGSPRPSQIPVKSPTRRDKKEVSKPTNSQSSLGGLPSLESNKRIGNDRDMSDIDRRLVGLDVAEYDYDDDFESSNVSPLGPTPRSARSDHNVRSIEDEEIEEDIDEDISVAEDLLKSDPSVMDDLTTDRTVSPVDPISSCDYMEEVQHN